MSDICLILEGTYPYVTGGVSNCVYQLIKETPHINYSIFYIGANRDSLGEVKYPVPSNVRLIKKMFLFDYELPGKLTRTGENFDPQLIRDFHQAMNRGELTGFGKIYQDLFNADTRKLDPMDILSSEEAWVLLRDMYLEKFPPAEAPSFIDFFYTWRFTHYPMFKVLTAELPKADVYHALCTGYAGLAGVMARHRYRRPFMLTEHGIYSHERRIEILQAQWLLNTDNDIKARKQLPVFKKWWIRLFEVLSLLAYKEADQITTLYNGNVNKQVSYGADPEKIRVIPNGVDYPKLSAPSTITRGKELRVALVGRVVPIKDIKNFIKAIAQVAAKVPDVKVMMVGPTEEDEGYYQDCLQLVDILGLKDTIEFTGKRMVSEVYPAIDLLVLSSISEGQPLVILEGYCQGVPVVATDVGSCRELIEGMTAEDKALGPSGLVVPFGRSDLLGDAIVQILLDPELRERMSQAAKQRVSMFYQESKMVENYLSVYNKLLSERFWYGGNRI